MLQHLFKIIILLIFCNISYAKDFGSFVNSYDIAETDALEMIKNKSDISDINNLICTNNQ